jgi:Peptidase family M28
MRLKIRLFESAAIFRLLVLSLVLALSGLILWTLMIWMPGTNYTGPLPALNPLQSLLRNNLRRDVEMLATTIGPRNLQYPDNLKKASAFLLKELSDMGYVVERQTYRALDQNFENLIVEVPGKSRTQEIVVVGAHYDSAFNSPAANDNGSGVAAALELARSYASRQPSRTVRFAFFANEEPPFHWTRDMGSYVYAKSCKDRAEKIVGMFSLETIGYYSDAPQSQRYPEPIDKFYPSTGNFIGFVSNIGSRELLRNALRSFRLHAKFPSEGAALPNQLPGVGWSDHWSFWQMGYPAVMITDTATFRYPDYHQETDTPEKLDYDRMTLVVSGIEQMLGDLTGAPV